MKRLLLLVAALALALAVPTLALPPQCSCPFCFQHSGTTTCTLVPGNTVTTCGSYIPTHCTMPN